MQTSKYKFDIDLWTTKSKWALPPVMDNTCVKYYHCMSKGNGVIVRKLLFNRQADGWTDKQPS